ncbi:MAG: hypothetical protein ACFFDT_13340 [Candidatus Hodarchaeota archaeon]
MPDVELLKICLMGHPTELKNKWVRRFAEGKFTTNYLPIQGVDIMTKQIQVDGNYIKLILVDVASQEFFRKKQTSYYRGASTAIITFDKGDRDSFKAVRRWYKEFVNDINRLKRSRYQVPIALVGFITKAESVTPTFLKIQKRLKNTDWINKGDIEEIDEEVTTAEGQSLAEELGLSYYETRPTDKKIEQIFHDLVFKVLQKDISSSEKDKRGSGGN